MQPFHKQKSQILSYLRPTFLPTYVTVVTVVTLVTVVTEVSSEKNHAKKSCNVLALELCTPKKLNLPTYLPTYLPYVAI